ncbi:DUF6507 family protein [Leifsonia aquatica]|uniref:DUF6507 family protein n=1 Tax=Leifsonia aquatica TaxID=144185 RepID=UPI0028AEF9BD|nr:DUF6507 family protein [Leifsonia aquatica]
MGEFAVELEGLRSAARSIDDIATDATVSAGVKHPSDVGAGVLADAIATFAQKTGHSWTERLAKTQDLADGLRAAATAYASADQDGRDGIRSAARAF